MTWKKSVGWMLVALLVWFTSSLALAETVADSATYTLEEAQMSITLPSSWLVITRETPEDDPVFAQLELEYRPIMKKFKKSNLYLASNSGVAPVMEMNVFLAKDVRTFDYNLYSDEALQAIIDNTLAQTAQNQENQEISYSGGSIYQHSQAKFVVLDGYRSDLEADVRQYGTVINGMAVSIIFGNYDASIGEEELAQIQSIVDSISFAQVQEPSSSAVKLANKFNENPDLAANPSQDGPNWLFAIAGFALIIGGLVLLVRKRRQK